MTGKTTVRQRKKQINNQNNPKHPTNQTETGGGFISILKSILFYGLCFAAVLICFCVYGCIRSPYSIHSFKEEDIVTMVERAGVLKENNRLTKGTKIFLPAPESIVEDEFGNLYAGLTTGNIVKIAPSSDGIIGAGQAVNITSGFIEGATCLNKNKDRGRPLGMRLVGNLLYVADAFYGIYTVDTKTNKVKMLIPPNDVSPPMAFPDDLTISKDGKRIYFTDVSSEHTLSDVMAISMRGLCDSRVFQYDIPTKKLKLVLSGLCFGNGIQLNEDESKIIIAETTRSRLRIIDIKTWETIKVVKFPAFIDNIRASSKGTLWVACSVLMTGMNEFMDRNPMFRQSLLGLFSSEQLMKSIKRESNAVFEMNENGEILQSLYDVNGELTYGLTQATELSDGRLALGSYVANYLSFLNVKDSKPIGKI